MALILIEVPFHWTEILVSYIIGLAFIQFLLTKVIVVAWDSLKSISAMTFKNFNQLFDDVNVTFDLSISTVIIIFLKV